MFYRNWPRITSLLALLIFAACEPAADATPGRSASTNTVAPSAALTLVATAEPATMVTTTQAPSATPQMTAIVPPTSIPTPTSTPAPTLQQSKSLNYSIDNFDSGDDEFNFLFQLDATAGFESQELSRIDYMSTHSATLSVPNGCKYQNVGYDTSDRNLLWAYAVTCGDPLNSSLKAYIENEKSRINRMRENLAFGIVDMGVAYETLLGVPVGSGKGLGINVRPNNRTEPDTAYQFTVYDEDGIPRGRGVVSWTRPELNVKSEKSLGPFELSPNELDAYGAGGPLTKSFDLRPFFSVLMNTADFGGPQLDLEEEIIYLGGKINEIDTYIYGTQIKDWIERNVSIIAGPVQGPNP